MIRREQKIYVLGGLADTDSLEAKIRKDVLVYDTTQRTWLPPLKKSFVSSKKYRRLSVENIYCGQRLCYVIYQGKDKESESIFFIDEIDVENIGVNGFKLSSKFMSNLPTWFKLPYSLWYDEGSFVYVAGNAGFAR